MKHGCMKSCALSVAAVFIFLNLYGYVVHGRLLMGEYEAVSFLWRNEAEMRTFWPAWLVYYVLLACVTTCWYAKTKDSLAACAPKSAANNGPRCPVKSGGALFGFKLGLVMGLGMGSAYLYMPIPLSLGVKWFFAGLCEGLGIGLILGVLQPGSSCHIGGTNNKEMP